MDEITKKDIPVLGFYLLYFIWSLLMVMLFWGQLNHFGIINLDTFIEDKLGSWAVFISVAILPGVLAYVLSLLTFKRGGEDTQPES